MSDPFDYQAPLPDDDISTDQNIALGLSGLMSPASAQSLVLPPSATPGQSGAGQTTPITGNLATAPSQAQPRVSGPAMIPSVATKPESLGPGAQLQRAGITPTKPLGQNGPSLSDTNGVAAGSPLSDLHPSRSGVAAAIAQQPSAAYRQVPLQNAGLNSIPGYNRASTLPAITPSQPATASTPVQSLQQRWSGILNRNPQTRQAALINAGGPSRSLPALQTSGGGPNLGTPTSQSVIAPRGTLPGDQNEVGRLLSTGSGVSQIKNPVVRDIARVGDVALSALTPGWAQWAPGTTGNHERLLEQAEGRVSNDEDQLKNAAALADTQSQTQQRNATAAMNTARPVTADEAKALGNPALEGSMMLPRDIGRLQAQGVKNSGNLNTVTQKDIQTAAAKGQKPVYGDPKNPQAVTGFEDDKTSGAYQSRVVQDNLRQAQQQEAQAKAELATAGNDPNSPAYRLAVQKAKTASANSAAANIRAQAYMGNYKMHALGTDLNNNPLNAISETPDSRPIGTSVAPQYAKTAGNIAKFEDVYSSIDNANAALDEADKAGAKFNSPAMAAALSDPKTTAAQWITGQVNTSLNPQEQNLVITTKALREQIMAMRGAIGSGGLSDAQVNRLVDQLPSATTPDMNYASRQLATLRQQLDRLQRGIPKVNNGPRLQAPGSPANPTNPGGVPNSIPKGSSVLIRKGNDQAISTQTAQQYLQRAGGDPARARSMAQKDGWKF